MERTGLCANLAGLVCLDRACNTGGDLQNRRLGSPRDCPLTAKLPAPGSKLGVVAAATAQWTLVRAVGHAAPVLPRTARTLTTNGADVFLTQLELLHIRGHI